MNTKKFIIEIEEVVDITIARKKGWYLCGPSLYCSVYEPSIPIYIGNFADIVVESLKFQQQNLSENFVLKAIAIASNSDSHKLLFKDINEK